MWLYAYIVLQIAACVVICLLGLSLWFNAINKHITEDINSMNENWKSNQDPVELKERLYETIQNRAEAVQLSIEFREKIIYHGNVVQCVLSFAGVLTNIFKFIFMIYALWGIVTICGTLLMLNRDQVSDQYLDSFFYSQIFYDSYYFFNKGVST